MSLFQKQQEHQKKTVADITEQQTYICPLLSWTVLSLNLQNLYFLTEAQYT